MADYGIKAGANLNTDTDLTLKLTSKFSTLKLYKWVNASFTTNGSGVGSTTVAHDLGYTPVHSVWGKHASQFTFLSGTSYPDTFSLLNSANAYRPYGDGIISYADETEITIATTAVGTPFAGGASASTTYHFRVLIWVDVSENFTGSSSIAMANDYGFKISKPTKNVLTGQEYDMSYSSKYKSVGYYPTHIVTNTLTLPTMWASYHDTYEQAATYVDFNHSLGYAPLFLVYSDWNYLSLSGSALYEMPVARAYGTFPTNTGTEEVSAWCDSTRVRVLFRRDSTYQSGDTGYVHQAATRTIHVIIFAENLSGEESP